MHIYFTIGCNSNPNGWDDITRGFEFALLLSAKGVEVETAILKENYLVHTGFHENSHKIMAVGWDKAELDNFIRQADDIFEGIIRENFEADGFGSYDFDDHDIEVYFPEFIKRLQQVTSSVEPLDEKNEFYAVK